MQDIRKSVLSLAEVCDTLNLGRSLVLELTYSGDLPSFKVGRRRLYSADAIREWVASKSVPA